MFRGEPATKATYAHDVQAEVRKLPPVERAAVIDACGTAWRTIAETHRTVWLDEPTFNALTEAIRSVLGAKETQGLYRRVGRVLANNPGFQTAFEALIRISGLTPHTVLRFAPRARAAVVRNSGTLTYDRVSDVAATLTMVGFPASTWRLGSTALMLAGTWEGIVDVTGAIPKVTIRSLDLEGGSCVYSIRWSSR